MKIENWKGKKKRKINKLAVVLLQHSMANAKNQYSIVQKNKHKQNDAVKLKLF